MNTLIKERKSKLAPFEKSLLEMEAARKTLVEMQHWLAGQQVTVSTVAISKFLAVRRRRCWQSRMLDQLARCEHSAPPAGSASLAEAGLNQESLIKLLRVLIYQHASRLVTGSECVRQSAGITRMVIDYIDRQSDPALGKNETARSGQPSEFRELPLTPKQPAASPVQTISSHPNL